VLTVSDRILRKGVIVLAIVMVFSAWVVASPTVAASKAGYVSYNPATRTYTISPTGVDDTANIQATFDGCAAHSSPCTIQLTSGTFYTAQIAANNFRGSFLGTGMGTTTVQALPNLRVTTDYPYFDDHPPSASNPWPNLFTFVNGSYLVSGMTLIEPYAVPTQGYWVNGGGFADALFAFIHITGAHANAAVDHIKLVGAPGDFSTGGPILFNAINGIFTQSALVLPPATEFPEATLLQGTSRITNSAFNMIENPLSFEDLVQSQVTVSGNTFDTMEFTVYSFDLSQSTLVISQNVARNVMFQYGLYVINGYPINTHLPCELPSTLVVTDNDFEVTGFANFATTYNSPRHGCSWSLSAVFSGNTVRADPTSYGGIFIGWMNSTVIGNKVLGTDLLGSAGVYIQAGSSVVLGNEIVGSDLGVVLDGATGTVVVGNVIKDSQELGIALIDSASNNAVVRNQVTNSGTFDLFWDGTGTGNHWLKNVYTTSYPPNLST
jgi:parallel beta-helix repeat protein